MDGDIAVVWVKTHACEHTQEMLLPPATPFFRSPKLEVGYER